MDLTLVAYQTHIKCHKIIFPYQKCIVEHCVTFALLRGRASVVLSLGCWLGCDGGWCSGGSHSDAGHSELSWARLPSVLLKMFIVRRLLLPLLLAPIIIVILDSWPLENTADMIHIISTNTNLRMESLKVLAFATFA